MAVIKKFRIKSFKEEESFIELKKISMFYNKREILNNLSLKKTRHIRAQHIPSEIKFFTIVFTNFFIF